MADPNLKESPIFGIQYPKEYVDPFWTYFDVNFINSLESAVLIPEAKACVVDYDAANFQLVGDTLSWSAFKIYTLYGGGTITVPMGSTLFFTDGRYWGASFDGAWVRPLVADQVASGSWHSGLPLSLNNTQIPIIRRDGTSLVRCAKSAFGGGGVVFPPAASGLVVPVTTNAISNGNALVAAYAVAAGLGATASRKVRLYLPDAEYDLGTQQLLLNAEHVDVLGFGISRFNRAQSAYDTPGAYIYGTHASSVVRVYAADIELRGVRVYNAGAGHAIDASPGALPNVGHRLIDIYASCSSGTKCGIYGQSLNGFYEHCHSPLAMLQTDSFAGVARWCSGGDYSFGSRIDMDMMDNAYVAGEFYHCFGGAYSFGCSDYGSGWFDAYAEDCEAGHYSFGATRDLGATMSQAGLFTGEVKRCTAGDYSYGYEPNGKSLLSFTGIALDSDGGGYCFAGAASGTFSGRAERCRGGSDCFGYDFEGVLVDCAWTQLGYKNVRPVGQLIRCRTLEGTKNQTYLYLMADSSTGCYLDGCTFRNQNGAPLDCSGASVNGPHIYNCTLVADSGVDSITASAPVIATILHCRMNAGINANVTNTEAAPYNVVNNPNIATLP